MAHGVQCSVLRANYQALMKEQPEVRNPASTRAQRRKKERPPRSSANTLTQATKLREDRCQNVPTNKDFSDAMRNLSTSSSSNDRQSVWA